MNENSTPDIGDAIDAIVTQPDTFVVETLELFKTLLFGSMNIFIKVGIVLLIMLIAKKLVTTFIDNLSVSYTHLTLPTMAVV